MGYNPSKAVSGSTDVRTLCIGRLENTPKSKRSFTKKHTSITSELQLYQNQFPVLSNITHLLTKAIDRQPVGGSPLRRCSRLRNRFSYHINRSPDGVLGSEDWSIPSRQTYREGGRLRQGCLVGSCEQTNDTRGVYLFSLNRFVDGAVIARGTAVAFVSDSAVVVGACGNWRWVWRALCTAVVPPFRCPASRESRY